MDEAERDPWCRAWRLLLLHGEDSVAAVDAEAEQGLPERDSGDAEWRKTADTAVDHQSSALGCATGLMVSAQARRIATGVNATARSL